MNIVCYQPWTFNKRLYHVTYIALLCDAVYCALNVYFYAISIFGMSMFDVA